MCWPRRACSPNPTTCAASLRASCSARRPTWGLGPARCCTETEAERCLLPCRRVVVAMPAPSRRRRRGLCAAAVSGGCRCCEAPLAKRLPPEAEAEASERHHRRQRDSSAHPRTSYSHAPRAASSHISRPNRRRCQVQRHAPASPSHGAWTCLETPLRAAGISLHRRRTRGFQWQRRVSDPASLL